VGNLFDAANAPEGVPEELIVGDFFQFKVSTLSSDYPNNLYTMNFVARIATGNSSEITVTATASGDDYLFTQASSVTDSHDVGHYHYQLEVVRNSDSNRLVVDRGEFDVKSDYDNNLDPRGHAEIMLGKIESILEGKADSDVSSYSIAGRSLSKYSPSELVDWRAFYKKEVALHKREEAIKHGRKSKSTILMRF